MKATERIKLCQRIEQLIHRHGGAHKPNELGTMQLLTPLGKLYVTVEPTNRFSDGSIRKLFNIFCRFDETERIAELAKWNRTAKDVWDTMNQNSGKWNYHAIDKTAEFWVECFERHINAIMGIPMSQVA